MTTIILTLLIVWIAPPAWVIYVNIKARRRYGQSTPLRYVLQQWRSLLNWPLGVIAWLRGR